MLLLLNGFEGFIYLDFDGGKGAYRYPHFATAVFQIAFLNRNLEDG